MGRLLPTVCGGNGGGGKLGSCNTANVDDDDVDVDLDLDMDDDGDADDDNDVVITDELLLFCVAYLAIFLG